MKGRFSRTQIHSAEVKLNSAAVAFHTLLLVCQRLASASSPGANKARLCIVIQLAETRKSFSPGPWPTKSCVSLLV